MASASYPCRCARPTINKIIPAWSTYIITEKLQTADAPMSRDSTNVDLFMQAVYEDSNLEMDWLWLATKFRSSTQKRYALERTLRINPRSAIAKRGLARLS